MAQTADKVLKVLMHDKLEMASVQRPYVWTADKAITLAEDLIEKNKNAPTFLGSIYSRTDVIDDYGSEKTVIVDGQQRVLTISLYIILLVKDLQSIVNLNDCYENIKKLKASNNIDRASFNAIINDDKNYIRTDKSALSKTFKKLKKEYSTWSPEKKQKLWLGIHNALWYVNEVPQGCSDTEFYKNVNSAGTIMSDEDVIKVFFPDTDDEDTYEWYESLRGNFNELLDKSIFLSFLNYIFEKNNHHKDNIINFYEKNAKTLDRENLEKIANAFISLYSDEYYYAFSRTYKRELLWKMVDLYLSNNPEKDDILLKIKQFLALSDLWLESSICNTQTYIFNIELWRSLSPKINNSITLSDLKQEINIFATQFGGIDEIKKGALYYLENENLYKKSNGRTFPFILKKLDDIYHGNAYSRDPNMKWTGEHIWAQNCKLKPPKDYVHRLGNLTLLNQGNNSRASKNLPENKVMEDCYKNSGFGLTTDLLNITTFREPEIEARGKKLANDFINFLGF